MKLHSLFANLRLVPLLTVAMLYLSAAALWPPFPALINTPKAYANQAVDRQGSFVPGEVLLKLKDPQPTPDSAFLESILPGFSATLKETVQGLDVIRLNVPTGRELEAVEQLHSNPLVEWAEPNYLRSVLRIPNDKLYSEYQWNLRKIRAEDAWEITTGSSNVIVAVLDTGVDAFHPDLANKLVPGYDFLNDDRDPTDDSGHGTHNCGVIGAASNNDMGVAGLAWGSRIMPIKVLNSSGVGPDSVIARGIVYATDHGAKVINMSLGSSSASQVLERAVRYAYDKGVMLVAAAGNTANLDNAPIYPAAYEQVLAVGATDENDKVCDFSQHHPYVGVSAPGVHIVSTYWNGSSHDYASASGTSSAAPHVSGLAALIWSANPALTNRQVRSIIESTADDLGPPGKDQYYGTGRINSYKALVAARPPVAPSPTPVATPMPATPSPSPTPVPTLAPAPPQAPVPAMVPRVAWYFAEGSTASPFDLWLLLQNPSSAAAIARVTYMKTDGSQLTRDEWLPPSSRKSIYVNQIIPDAEVSIKVESDALLFAERSMYFRSDGHSTVGVAAPSTKWYLAEGSTRGDFDTWLLLQNPLSSRAEASITFLSSDGQKRELSVGLQPTSRKSIYVNQILPDADVSTIVLSDQPIIAERAMYFRRTGGHGSVAANQLSKTWYLAEGQTGNGFDTWLLVLNPNPQPANLKVTFMKADGSAPASYYSVGPNSRLSLYVNESIPSGQMGIRVESDQPVVAERSVYFAGGQGGHNAAATPLLSQEWYLPDGSTLDPFTETIAVLNPNDTVANIMVTFMKNGGGSEVKSYTLKPTSRLTLNVNELMPGTEISTKVTSDVPIAVERSMYFANGLGGTCSFGIPR